jgi:hypothetical protein
MMLSVSLCYTNFAIMRARIYLHLIVCFFLPSAPFLLLSYSPFLLSSPFLLPLTTSYLPYQLTNIGPIWPMVSMGVAYSVFAAALWPGVAIVVKPSHVGTAFGTITSMQVSVPIVGSKCNHWPRSLQILTTVYTDYCLY